MEERNRKELAALFPDNESKIEVAGIPDVYRTLQMELILNLMDSIHV